METILLVLTLCSPVTGKCDEYIIDTFDAESISECEERIINSPRPQGLRCEL